MKRLTGLLWICVEAGFVAYVVLHLTGCSTLGHAVDLATGRNPDPAEYFMVTEDEVSAQMEILSVPPENPGAVKYNATDNVYEFTPEATKKALRDSILKTIYEKKIEGYIGKYRPQTFGTAFKKDVGTIGVFLVIVGVVAGFLY